MFVSVGRDAAALATLAVPEVAVSWMRSAELSASEVQQLYNMGK